MVLFFTSRDATHTLLVERICSRSARGNLRNKVFREMRVGFLDVFEQEESQYSLQNDGSYIQVMKRTLHEKTIWFWASPHQPHSMYNLFLDHIQPLFALEHVNDDENSIQFQEITAPYWKKNGTEFIRQKTRRPGTIP